MTTTHVLVLLIVPAVLRFEPHASVVGILRAVGVVVLNEFTIQGPLRYVLSLLVSAVLYTAVCSSVQHVSPV